MSAPSLLVLGHFASNLDGAAIEYGPCSKTVPDAFPARGGEPADRVDPACRPVGREHADERVADEVFLGNEADALVLHRLEAAVGAAIAVVAHQEQMPLDRQSLASVKSGAVRLDRGCRRHI